MTLHSRRQLLWLGGAGLLAPRGLLAARSSGGLPLDGWAEPEAGDRTLSGATVLTHDGQVHEGWGIRIEGGRIAELGAGVKGGEELGGAWLVPGFTDAGCTVGMVEIGMESATRDDDEPSDAVTPDVRAWNGYNPLSSVVPVTRMEGITSVVLHPSTRRLISGQAGLLRTVGLLPSEAIITAPVGLCINMGRAGITGDGPRSRMGVAQRLRALLEEHAPEDEPEEDDSKKKRKKKDDEPEEDEDEGTLAEKALEALAAGEMLAIVKAERVDDIAMALELAAAYDLRMCLLGAAEGHLIARRIADAGVGVLLGPLTVQPSSFEHLHARPYNAKILADAGVPLAFRSGSGHFARQLRSHAAVAVAHGLPWESAITALTAGAGAVLGAEGHGRLEVGAPATLFQIAGDPLQPRYRVERMWIDGRAVSLRSRQTELFERYREL